MGHAPLLGFVHKPPQAYERVPKKRHRHTHRTYPVILPKRPDIITAQNKRYALALVLVHLLQNAPFTHQVRSKVNVIRDDFRGSLQKVFSMHRCNPFGGLRYVAAGRTLRGRPAAFLFSSKKPVKKKILTFLLCSNIFLKSTYSVTTLASKKS
jgi:hypothetical protein